MLIAVISVIGLYLTLDEKHLVWFTDYWEIIRFIERRDEQFVPYRHCKSLAVTSTSQEKKLHQPAKKSDLFNE